MDGLLPRAVLHQLKLPSRGVSTANDHPVGIFQVRHLAARIAVIIDLAGRVRSGHVVLFPFHLTAVVIFIIDHREQIRDRRQPVCEVPCLFGRRFSFNLED